MASSHPYLRRQGLVVFFFFLGGGFSRFFFFRNGYVLRIQVHGHPHPRRRSAGAAVKGEESQAVRCASVRAPAWEQEGLLVKDREL